MTSVESTGDPSDSLNGDEVKYSGKKDEHCESTNSGLEQQQQPQGEGQPTMDEAGVMSKENQDVLEKLGEIYLTDEDTEMLLEEAYAMNRQLKEILRQQEKGGSNGSDSGSIRRVPRSEMHRELNVKHSVLPPIKKSQALKQHDIYSARMARPHQSTSSIDSSKSMSAASRKTSSSAHSGHKDSSRKCRSQKSASSCSSKQSVGGDRPAWNDRFSFT